jgi:GMP synthase-like glutamine amidotransferase
VASFPLYEFHHDHVLSHSPQFLKIGSSSSCDIEVLVSKDKSILTIQSHPEYTK